MTRLSVLLLFMALAFSQICLAQKADDVYGGKISKSISIADDLSFSFDDVVKGYMILPSGALQYGYFRFNGNKVVYRDSVTNNIKRYGPNDINGFVCGIVDSIKTRLSQVWNSTNTSLGYNDDPNKTRFFSRGMNGFLTADTFKVYLKTYAALQDPHMAAFGKKMITDKYFVKVMVTGPLVTLYKRVESKRTGGVMGQPGMNYDENIFYLKRENEKDYTELPSGNRAFKRLLADYLKDDPKLTEDIKNEVLGYYDLDKITARYNNKN